MQIIYSNECASPKVRANNSLPMTLHLVLVEGDDADLTVCAGVEALVRLGGEPAISVTIMRVKLALAVVQRLVVLRKDVVVFPLAARRQDGRRGQRLGLGFNGWQGRHQRRNLERRQR